MNLYFGRMRDLFSGHPVKMWYQLERMWME